MDCLLKRGSDYNASVMKETEVVDKLRSLSTFKFHEGGQDVGINIRNR